MFSNRRVAPVYMIRISCVTVARRCVSEIFNRGLLHDMIHCDLGFSDGQPSLPIISHCCRPSVQRCIAEAFCECWCNIQELLT